MTHALCVVSKKSKIPKQLAASGIPEGSFPKHGEENAGGRTVHAFSWIVILPVAVLTPAALALVSAQD